MSGDALRLVQDERVGRAYVAARPIAPDEVLLDEAPAIVVTRRAINQALLDVGFPDEVGYDDEPDEWDQPRDGGRTRAVDVARLRTFLSAPKSVRRALLGLYAPPLDSSHSAVRAAAETAAWFRRTYAEECAGWSPAELQRALLVFDANAHHVGDSAAGVFLRSAMFAHSCAPVARFDFLPPAAPGGPPVIRNVAAAGAAAGALVSVSYLGHFVWASRRVRRALLRQDKFFDCACERCSAPRDPCRSMPCPSCCPRSAAGLVDPTAPPGPLVCPEEGPGGAEAWPCGACGRRFTYAEVCAAARMSEAAEERIERQVVHFDRAAAARGGPDSMEGLELRWRAAAGRLGPTHWAPVRLRLIAAECLAGMGPAAAGRLRAAADGLAAWLRGVAGLEPGPLLADLYARLPPAGGPD